MQEIEIRQGAEIGRPSVLYAVATGSRERVESVEVGGVASIVAEGRLPDRPILNLGLQRRMAPRPRLALRLPPRMPDSSSAHMDGY